MHIIKVIQDLQPLQNAKKYQYIILYTASILIPCQNMLPTFSGQLQAFCQRRWNKF